MVVFYQESRMLVLFAISLLLLPPNTEACNGTFTESSGTIESPNYPSNYGNGLDCFYVIRRPEGERVTVTFEAFGLQYVNGCAADFLMLRDGDSATSPFINSLCGSDLPSPKRSFGNTMYIHFHSDSSVTGSGFRFSYTSGVRQESFFLIASSSRAIFRVDLETMSNIVIPGLSLLNPMAVDFDPVAGKVYWTDVMFKTIASANLDGTDQRVFRQLNSSAIPDGLAVDPVSRLVFYTDAGNDIIAVMTISGSLYRTIISTELDQPRAIVLDTLNGVMFWTDWGSSSKIEKANYDGSDRRTIVTGFLVLPYALAIDLQNQRLYWVDADTHYVEYCGFDGSGRKQLYETQDTHIFGVTYYNNSLYATDWMVGSNTTVSRIIRFKTTGEVAREIGSGKFRMNGIHLHVEDNWQRGPNGCSEYDGGCSYICIPSAGNSSKCMCPDAPTTCVEATTTAAPAISVRLDGPDLFDTDGSKEMTLTCDPDGPKPVSDVSWNVPCTRRQGRECVWIPTAPDDDEKAITCSIRYTDGQSGGGSFKVNLNYPPRVPPEIHGYKTDDELQVGDSLTMTCQVRGGKPLVTSVIFSCEGYPDSEKDISSDSEVQSLLVIDSLRAEDSGKRCICTAEWKQNELYVLSATRILRVTGSPTTATTTALPSTGVPIAVVAGASAGGVVLIVLTVVVVVVIIRRRGKPQYEYPGRPKNTGPDQQEEENPYSTLEQPGMPINLLPRDNMANILPEDFDHFDDKRMSSIYHEIEQISEADAYLHPISNPNYSVAAIFDPLRHDYSGRIDDGSSA